MSFQLRPSSIYKRPRLPVSRTGSTPLLIALSLAWTMTGRRDSIRSRSSVREANCSPRSRSRQYCHLRDRHPRCSTNLSKVCSISPSAWARRSSRRPSQSGPLSENFLPPGFGQLGNAVRLQFILGKEKADQVAVQSPVLAQVLFARPELEDDERRLGLPGVEPGAELARRGARAGRVLSVAPAGGEFEGAQGTLALGAQGLLPPGGSRPDRPTSRLA
jgi:hypothetical protein